MWEAVIYATVGLFVILVPTIYWWRHQRLSQKATATLTNAVETGRDQPVSLHPVIDPNICIGSGACVRACPEKSILGLIENAGKLINPSNCIGHGMCQAACPVNAISLVFGTEKRGVDIPQLKGTFETNVNGVFIAGELGGMGLIRNAVIQGKQAVEFISKSLEKEDNRDALDLIIVGSGPAGISASLQAKAENLKFITIDQDDLGGTILSYPRRKLVMTQPMELPGYGTIKVREVHKESLLNTFQTVFQKTDLTVHTEEKCESIVRENGHFRVLTTKGEHHARRVLLAIGRRGTPRKLNVPGEAPPRVYYRLLDPENFNGMHILVVGGGDSAVEAAVTLGEQPGTTVHLSYRQDRVFRVKEGNSIRLEKAIKSGTVIPLYKSNVIRIEPEEVILDVDGEEMHLQNEQVFVFAGGILPTDFLQSIGIEFTRKFGEV
jgi:thioredoxin reductase/ferredoxin